MEKEKIAALLDKYRRGSITGEEKAFLESWYLQYRESESGAYGSRQLLEDSAVVKSALKKTVSPPGKRRLLYTAAAAAIFILSAIFIIYRNSLWQPPLSAPGTANSEAISPGGNKATLTLIGSQHSVAGSSTIQLSGEKEGIYSDGTAFRYSDGTTVGSDLPDGPPAQYALLATPRGGQYQVRLPDGSGVWLNAGSTLRYPVSFEGLKQRRVILSGEAYFEVAPDEQHPFLVSTQNQTMEVLGTRFNINSYAAEAIAKTTLLEGSLKVFVGGHATAGGKAATNGSENKGRLLVPGQQAILEKGRITVTRVDPEEAVAWKEGYFQFNNKNLETALAELARWYDVEVVFRNDKMRRQKLAGTISKYARISQVLEKMELTGIIHFQIAGRTIIVE